MGPSFPEFTLSGMSLHPSAEQAGDCSKRIESNYSLQHSCEPGCVKCTLQPQLSVDSQPPPCLLREEDEDLSIWDLLAGQRQRRMGTQACKIKRSLFLAMSHRALGRWYGTWQEGVRKKQHRSHYLDNALCPTVTQLGGDPWCHPQLSGAWKVDEFLSD
jgi:hypothetical protein